MHSKFLVDGINTQLFITSDPQFGAQGLFDNLPIRKRFGDIEDLHRELVHNWNAVINRDDYVLCLGDFTQNLKDKKKSMELVETYTRQLRGRKILIRGNHDAEDTSWYYDSGWNCLIEYPLIILDGHMEWIPAPTPFCGCLITEVNDIRILFSHFAIYEDEFDDRRYLVEKAYMRELYDRYHCTINIHGHNHTRPIDHPDCFSVCVEHTYFTPITLGQFLRQHEELVTKKIA